LLFRVITRLLKQQFVYYSNEAEDEASF